jgi:molybdopterin biosynthesis enzyme MoaB
MRAKGGESTPFAYLSRAVAGVLRQCLIVNLPGSPRGALESLAAMEPILEHALATLAGSFDHALGSDDQIPAEMPASGPFQDKHS